MLLAMRQRPVLAAMNACLAISCLLFLILTRPVKAAAAAGGEVQLSDQIKLLFEVDALSSLDDFQLTGSQAKALAEMADGAAGTIPADEAAEVKIDAEYQKALSELRSALVAGDDDRIDAARDKVAEIEDNQSDDAQPDVDITETAKSKSGAALKILSPRQLAQYLGRNSDDVSEPTEVVDDVLDDCHKMTVDEFNAARDDASDEIEMLVAGMGKHKTRSAAAQNVTKLLDRARHLSEADFQAQKADLEAEAQQDMQEIDPVGALRHWTIRELAQLLSNPELPTAVEEYAARKKSQ